MRTSPTPSSPSSVMTCTNVRFRQAVPSTWLLTSTIFIGDSPTPLSGMQLLRDVVLHAFVSLSGSTHPKWRRCFIYRLTDREHDARPFLSHKWLDIELRLMYHYTI